ncbi:MAG: thiamine pyrophosphate-dependent dehydrogenase E1 component subunit alpha [Elusimicrobia bacterium]|nr:thiamine pyrophosphate-dependent dehydrogenase E1 component subunit alpha [Elusimicrobiota bacterium]MDE2236346.1 thiamine pyrophosphate-dependent dehydrogenase E1 component subunit alpha [Elusimicrobiota bacterium]MDE2426061.1 thiamine pyrophosphate-dependent dehydrogenase E1 component subunit alpha [Elusimicrobiota bacterium]
MAAKTKAAKPSGGLDPRSALKIHSLMVKARCLEERLIKMSKSGEGFFWIGGPGEEAFNVPLGLQVKKGRGLAHDFLHLHYRSSAILTAMGAPVIDSLRQMRSVATDRYSKGRQFINHPSIPEWNVVPVSPTIETQYSTAIGTGIAQARAKTDAITIVNGGDAGTAEADFHSCLNWANRPMLPLPILMIVVNNGYGISTPEPTQHGEKNISDWARVFGMPHQTVDGNDVSASWRAIAEAMAYVRKERKPYLLEAKTSRLYGHSSSSGANRIAEPDCIGLFEAELVERGLADKARLEGVWKAASAEVDAANQEVKQEPYPAAESIWEDVFPGGLPGSYPTRGGSF